MDTYTPNKRDDSTLGLGVIRVSTQTISYLAVRNYTFKETPEETELCLYTEEYPVVLTLVEEDDCFDVVKVTIDSEPIKLFAPSNKLFFTSASMWLNGNISGKLKRK